MADKMEGQPADFIETPEASVEDIIPADYWATLPNIERKRLQTSTSVAWSCNKMVSISINALYIVVVYLFFLLYK